MRSEPGCKSHLAALRMNKICLHKTVGRNGGDDLKSGQEQWIVSIVNESVYSFPKEPVKRILGWYSKIDWVGIM